MDFYDELFLNVKKSSVETQVDHQAPGSDAGAARGWV